MQTRAGDHLFYILLLLLRATQPDKPEEVPFFF